MKTNDATIPQTKVPNTNEWNPEFDATGAESVATKSRIALTKQQQEFAQHISQNGLDKH